MEQKQRYDYQIMVEGSLSEQWVSWFEHLRIKKQGENTLLVLTKVDLSELYGVLTLLRDFNFSLICVHRMDKKNDG